MTTPAKAPHDRITFVHRATSRERGHWIHPYQGEPRCVLEAHATDLTRRETVHVSGLVEWSIHGTSEGEDVDQSGVRHYEGPLDLERVTAARMSMGWRVAS